MGVFLPTYFSPIFQFSNIIKFNKIIFENEDNFQKQSYRNRCYIYGPNGKQMLNIPIKKNTNLEKQKTKDTLVDNSLKWQDQHFKSLKASYNCSPFFEFFEDDLQKIFTKKYRYLNDINLDTFLFLLDALQLEVSHKNTNEYQKNKMKNDFRDIANIKQEINKPFPKYIQVFTEKHGFIPNLSTLDLLFMEGPNAISFLS
ncbi:MAG: Uncharacterised protein [Polaribacter sp. SA4-10]|nr:MAG: Uncharacterised protein [Polaribacter sp. SA4-10]|tara:strand:+ start:1212 stop:1811 length:600 start_codon:yes stop_codon:yes gene_type:complete